MDEFAKAIEVAAKDLYKVYWTTLTPDLMLNWGDKDWDLVQDNQKQGWRAVATAMGNALSNVVAVYGYNGESDYQGLDAMIAPPDHK